MAYIECIPYESISTLQYLMHKHGQTYPKNLTENAANF